jgi:hypothetical protein
MYYFIGTAIFALLAFVLVYAFLQTKKREKKWEQEEHRKGR